VVSRVRRLLRSPLGRIIVRVPENPRLLGRQLAGLGHASSVDAGRIPPAFIDWYLALSRETDWARHERSMVRAVVARGGYAPGVVPAGPEIGPRSPGAGSVGGPPAVRSLTSCSGVG
jgi:hypothetical protein